MSVSIRISPQASKVLASEARSTASDATVIRMRIKKSSSRKPSFYTTYSSIRAPYSTDNESVIINMIHNAGGALAPSLVYEGMIGEP